MISARVYGRLRNAYSVEEAGDLVVVAMGPLYESGAVFVMFILWVSFSGLFGCRYILI